MLIKPLHPSFILPVCSTEHAGAYDIYMPESGKLLPNEQLLVPLGFSTEIPNNHVALLLPRSSTGAKKRIVLANTIGVIDPDYRGEWMASLVSQNDEIVEWAAGDRLLQFLIMPTVKLDLYVSEILSDTARGEGGFGSTG